ncbi:hypothetical protein F0562_034179 [Nyssa sinensis]|uniref:Uncharacterized protein n=1 Tax=Nyssa sinensis TaxID=561372 RepID=A0A5J5AKQ3_9ASTE|nr:hypothetical protein F0562_034179 [Nyssa sinensis]
MPCEKSTRNYGWCNFFLRSLCFCRFPFRAGVVHEDVLNIWILLFLYLIIHLVLRLFIQRPISLRNVCWANKCGPRERGG